MVKKVRGWGLFGGKVCGVCVGEGGWCRNGDFECECGTREDVSG